MIEISKGGILSVNVTDVVEQTSRCNFLLVVKILKNISANRNNVGVLEIQLFVKTVIIVQIHGHKLRDARTQRKL